MIDIGYVQGMLPGWVAIRNDFYGLAREIALCCRHLELRELQLNQLALAASASPVLMVVMAACDDRNVRMAIAERKSFLSYGAVVKLLLCDDDKEVRMAAIKIGLDLGDVIAATPAMFKKLRLVDATVVLVAAMFVAVGAGLGALRAQANGMRDEFKMGEGIAHWMGLTVLAPS